MCGKCVSRRKREAKALASLRGGENNLGGATGGAMEEAAPPSPGAPGPQERQAMAVDPTLMPSRLSSAKISYLASLLVKGPCPKNQLGGLHQMPLGGQQQLALGGMQQLTLGRTTATAASRTAAV
jgi:hypothetical protein